MTSEIQMLSRIKVYTKPLKYDDKGKLYYLENDERKYDVERFKRYDTDLKQSKSFVTAFLKLIHSAMQESTVYSDVQDVGNTTRTLRAPSYSYGRFMEADTADNVDTYGIVIGTSDTAETNTDYSLGSKISDGSGSGEMAYGNHAYDTTAVVSTNVDFEYRRTFLNTSGASIDVKEIGLYVLSRLSDAASGYFCIGREVITTATVADSETLEVVITMRTTV